jgi:hypothetical protein
MLNYDYLLEHGVKIETLEPEEKFTDYCGDKMKRVSNSEDNDSIKHAQYADCGLITCYSASALVIRGWG